MIIYICDQCGIKIPIVKKTIFEGTIAETTAEVLDQGRLKCEQLDLSRLPLNEDYHLCKSCAEKISTQIDYELLKLKNEILSNSGLSMYEMRKCGMTYQEIGDKFGISRQRVHQLLKGLKI